MAESYHAWVELPCVASCHAWVDFPHEAVMPPRVALVVPLHSSVILCSGSATS